MSNKRLAQLFGMGSAIALVLAVGFSTLLDWNYQRRERARTAEMLKHALHAGNPPSPESFYPMYAVDPQPKTTFEIMTVDEAADVVTDDETVLALEINGEARAYPINMMAGPSREIFNDELGGRPIAATW